MEHIFIKQLEVYGYHGVYEQEKRDGQNFLIDADITLQETRANQTDDLEDTVNYGSVCYFIRDYFRNHTYQLLEALTNRLSEALLEEYSGIAAVKLSIGKPQAPIEMNFENVGIWVEKKWHRVYLSVGSNMGDKQAYIDQGIEDLKKHAGIRRVRESKRIETKPYGYTDQDSFLNLAVELETYLSPYELLDAIHEIEAAANRVREIHWGPRTLDMDIVFYDMLCMTEADLIIPHMDMENRQFVLEPLCMLNPGLIHPVLHKSVTRLLQEVQEQI